MQFEMIQSYFKQGKLNVNNILDLGCGCAYNKEFKSGHFLYHYYFEFSPRVVIGVDNEAAKFWTNFNDFNNLFPDKLNRSQFEQTFTFKCKSIENFLSDNQLKFDLIILSNILHFFKLDKICELLSSLKNALNLKGMIYLEMANKDHHSFDGDNVTKINHYSKSQIIDILMQCNYDVNRFIGDGSHWNIIITP